MVVSLNLSLSFETFESFTISDMRHAHPLLIQHGFALVIMMSSRAALLPGHRLDGIYAVECCAYAVRGVRVISRAFPYVPA